ncbi:MAG: cobalamin-dependent protein [Spirochaetales bacterium]|nr:cobalamin-dependent protein [Spirochaetales bacterium]
MSKKLINAIADMKEKEAVSIVEEMVKNGSSPMAILDAVREAMDIVGRRYEKGIYFLPELILAGEMMKKINGIIKPEMEAAAPKGGRGKILMGTIKGDIHNIGKDIVTFMLEAHGFEVLDLGVDVPFEKFTEAIRDFKPNVVGLSGFLTLAFDAMKETITAIKNAGLRDNVKIMIGGGQIDEKVKTYTAADAFGKDAMAAVTLAKNWIGG